MAKTGKEAPKDHVGTPTAIILSVLCAIVIYGIEELKASVALADGFPLRSVLVVAIGLGLALCFFWRRLPQNVFRTMSAGLYLFALWLTLLLATLTPILLTGEWAGPRYILFQQVGLGLMALSALSLMVGFLGYQKPIPAVTATGVGSVVLMALSLFGFVRPVGSHEHEELLSAKTKKGGAQGAHTEKAEETIAAGHTAEHAEKHADEHGKDHHADTLENQEDLIRAEQGDFEAFAGAKEKEPAAEKAEQAAHGRKNEHGAHPGEGHEEKPARKEKGHKLAKDSSLEKIKSKAAKKKGIGLSARSLHGDEEEGHRLLSKTYEKQPHAKAATDDRAVADEHESNTPKKAKKGQHIHWSYEGAEGPRFWSDLSSDNKLCSSGKEQSPIDIPGAWPLMDDIKLDYRLSTLSIVDNGHTIQFTPGPGNSANIAGRRFQLMQFHIHAPSEHHISGHDSALEIHFVHKDAKGQLAVIGVLVQKGDASKVFDEMWSFIPQSINNATSPKDKNFNILSLLPQKLKAYRYKGSLTTPPCSENVLWSVVADNITMSDKQIKAFQKRYRNNARPIQGAKASASNH